MNGEPFAFDALGPGLAESARLRAEMADVRRRRRTRTAISEWLIEKLLLVSGLVAVLLILLIFVFLYREGIRALAAVSPRDWIGAYVEDFFTGKPVFKLIWQPVSEVPKYSLLPLVLGSLMVAIPATVIATGVGVGTGIYLSEVASPRLREVVKPVIEILAGIPTVVLGFLMLAVVATFVQETLGTMFRLNAFVGALGVALVIVPTIATITEDALRAVPDDLREAAYALGATRWEATWRAVVPAAVSGIAAAIILGVGRSLGETMIVLMATGNAAVVSANPFSSVRTMTATIAAELGAVAQNTPHYYALFFVGALLFTMTFLVNLLAEIAIQRMRRRMAQ